MVYEWSLLSLIKNTVPFVINLTSNFIILAMLPYYSNSRTFFLRIHSYFYVGSMFRMRRLHLTRSWASSPDNSLSDKSFLMLSNHLRFGFLTFSSPAHPSPSLSCPHSHTILLFSILAHTASTYFPALSWIFLPPSLLL